jgi:3-oxoacyl-[acyl-carrier protein] reductase
VSEKQVFVITGTSRGVGRHLAEYYVEAGAYVFGCSRGEIDYDPGTYRHFRLDVSDEAEVVRMFAEIRRVHGRVDVLINNAGMASMNHVLLTPLETARAVVETNFIGAFLFSREAAKLMTKRRYGRIVNLVTVATPLKLAGEAVYAASKAAVVSLTQILAREVADCGITVNAVGLAPVKTDLIRSVPREKIENLVNRQAIRRHAEFRDISNVIDFLLKPESDFITGQVVYLGGV